MLETVTDRDEVPVENEAIMDHCTPEARDLWFRCGWIVRPAQPPTTSPGAERAANTPAW